MNLIICLDNKNGMAFNHRRLTKDKVQRKHMMNVVNDSDILMNAYSAKMFDEDTDNITASDNYLEKAKKNDFVFCELDDIKEYKEKIQKIYIYRWNRLYMSDLRFDVKILEDYTLTSKEEFSGLSHESITFEVYER